MFKLSINSVLKTAQIILTVIFSLTLLASPIFGQKQVDADIRLLSVGQPIEHQIKSGETHVFGFNVKAGFYASAEVEQKNINIVVSLFAPDGKLVGEMDSKNGGLWRESVSCIAETSGIFRIEIKSQDAANILGNFTLKLAETRSATPKDRKRIEAERALNAGRKFYVQGGVQHEAAAKELEIALNLWRELGESYWEAITLLFVGWVNNDLSKYELALKAQTSAAEIFRQTKDRIGEAKALSILGNVHLLLSQYDKAREYYEQVLIIQREFKNRRAEGVILNNLGIVNGSLGQTERAREYLDLALAIKREFKDRSGEGGTLNNLANIYRFSSQYAKARDYYEQSLVIRRELKDRRGEGTTLNNLGLVYLELNQYETARNYFEQSLIIKRELSDRRGEGNALINIGNTHKNLNRNEQAQKYYEQALLIQREIKNRQGESEALSNLGDTFLNLEQYDKAREYYEKGLSIAREIKDREGESEDYNKLGNVYYKIGQYDKARENYEQALSIKLELGNQNGAGATLANLMYVWNELHASHLAILYGKQAVNAFQKIRKDIKGFDKKTQESFLKANETTYRELAKTLIAEGRLPEAQAVLDLLKDEEFKTIVRGGDDSDTVPYSKVEANAIKQVESLAALERERAELVKEKEQGALSADKQTRLDVIPNEIEAANKAFRLALAALGKSEASSTNRVAEIQSEKSLQRALQTLGKETNSGVVALYTVLGTEENENQTRTKFGWVILVTPTSRKAYPIDVADLEQTVFEFRDALSSDKYDARPAAQKLYQKLFRQTSAKQKMTLETDLQTLLEDSKGKTLMWSLDGILRYVPMAALHDGKNYLVEKYRNVIFTKESFLTMTEKNTTKWNALGLGVSERRENFNALPGAERELKDIVRLPQTTTGIFDGAIKLNKDFTEEATLKLWREGAFPVVHIASHYSFNANDPTSSFLLVGDGRLTFSEMQDKDNLFGAVDLLTLSACDTGVSGNGKEAEGFAYLAQSLGAKSVIASLWKVSDTGTPELMIRFYKLRAENPEISKGEAFRQAQLSLLGAETKDKQKGSTNKRAEIVGANEQEVDLLLFVKDPKKPFAHPHYWSSFVLIGNWR